MAQYNSSPLSAIPVTLLRSSELDHVRRFGSVSLTAAHTAVSLSHKWRDTTAHACLAHTNPLSGMTPPTTLIPSMLTWFNQG